MFKPKAARNLYISRINNIEVMGRIKTTMIKRTGNKLVAQHRSSFKTTFEENKQIVPTFVEVPSKKLRNVLTGYITRLMNKEE